MRTNMKNNKLIAAMALSMSLTLVSCSDEDAKTDNKTVATPVVSTITQQSTGIMDFIPADTPVLMVFSNDPKHPIPQNLISKMDKVYASLGDLIKVSIEENMTKHAGDEDKTKSTNEMITFMDKWFSEEGFKKLGFAIGESELAFYAVDLFPVLRMTLAKTHSMNEVLDELVAKANESKADTATKRDVNGKTIYQFGDKELQIMVNLDGNSIVASIAPPREVDNLMPKLLGFEKPSKSLVQSNQYQDTISKYNYLGNSLYWINIRDLADYFINPSEHKTAMLDILKVQDNMFSAECKTEILEIFDSIPRLVGGSTIMEEHKIDSHMIIEMANGLGGKLAALNGRIPKANADAALAYGISFDITAAKALAQEFVNTIESTPYKCEFMQDMNSQATTLKAQLETPLPPFVSNFKGFNVVIDELDLDLSKKDPKEMIKSLSAKFLLAVDNPEAIQGMASMMMPELQKLGIKVGSGAVNVSSLIPVKGDMMPINLDHVFMAMGNETIGLSLGEGTDTGLASAVAAESNNTLINFTIKADLYKDIFSGLGDLTSSLPEDVKKQFAMQKMFMSDMLWWQSESGTITFTDRGFEIDVDINY